MSKGLSVVNQQQKLSEWAERVSACRSSGMTVQDWCREQGIGAQTYYRWQRRLYELVQEQRGGEFTEITPPRRPANAVAVTVQVGGLEVAVHNGADAETVAAVMRAVKSC